MCRVGLQEAVGIAKMMRVHLALCALALKGPFSFFTPKYLPLCTLSCISSSWFIVTFSLISYFCREYLVDLIGNPGWLHEPDSLSNGLSSISISSPMQLPNYKSICFPENFKTLAKQYFLDCQSLNLMFNDASPGK